MRAACPVTAVAAATAASTMQAGMADGTELFSLHSTRSPVLAPIIVTTAPVSASHPRPARDVPDKQRTTSLPARLRWGFHSRASPRGKNSNKTLQSMEPPSLSLCWGRGRKGGVRFRPSLRLRSPTCQCTCVTYLCIAHSLTTKAEDKRRPPPSLAIETAGPQGQPAEGGPTSLLMYIA